MRNRFFKILIIVIILMANISSCKPIGDLTYQVTPTTLEMHSDSVQVSITIKIPEKGLKQNAIVGLSPKLGNYQLKTITIQGEEATGTGSVISYEYGGTIIFDDIIPYSPDFRTADLTIVGKVKIVEKEINFESEKICSGTNTTPLWVQNDDNALLGKNNFVRTTEEVFLGTQINFLKGRSEISSVELKDKDIIAFQEWMADAITNPKKKVKQILLISYAPPTGNVALKSQLATDRGESAKNAIQKILATIKFPVTDDLFNLEPKGEDWDGFVEALNNSTIPDKDIILRILHAYPDPEQRQQELKKLGDTFSRIEKDVVQQLERTVIKVFYDKVGWSDTELKSLYKSNPDTLSIEELLYTATLYDSLNSQLGIYIFASKKFPLDWRCPNNIGYICLLKHDFDNAKKQFEKANALNENPVTLNNLAIVERVQGNRTIANNLFMKALSAGPEVKYNLGIIDIQNGDYQNAIANFGKYNTFNKALAQVLNKDYEAALTTIEASPDKNSAIGFYLKAIIGARQKNLEMTLENLKNVIAIDNLLKAKAVQDVEFIEYFENSDFKAIVNK